MKKSRVACKTFYIACEGNRDKALVRFLLEGIFQADLDNNNIYIEFEEDSLGGNTGKVIDLALKKYNYDKRIAFTDNDVKIELKRQKELYNELGKCWGKQIPLTATWDELIKYHKCTDNPVVIISTPLNVESVILQFLGREKVLYQREFSDDNLERNKAELKSAVASIMGSNGNEDKEYKFYVEHFDKDYCIDKINKIPQLKLLLKSIFGIRYCAKILGIK